MLIKQKNNSFFMPTSSSLYILKYQLEIAASQALFADNTHLEIENKKTASNLGGSKLLDF